MPGSRAAFRPSREVRVLYLAARFPFPALKGDQVRAYHQLRLLGKRHRITLVAFSEGPVAPGDRAHVEGFCERVVTVPIARTHMARALATNALSPLPLQALLYRVPAMRSALRGLHGERFDLVHVQLARMAQHAADVDAPAVLDLIDALSLNMQRRAAAQRGPLRALFAHEAARMRRYERRLCETFAAVTVVSPVDRDAIGPYANLAVNGNGVDADAFAPGREPRTPGALVFSGNMGYFPNVNAVTWFAQAVLPHVKAEVPEVTFTIVGTQPPAAVRALAARDPAITVTGFVDDVRPYLARATACVAPMRTGTGMQNKVIEAMACGTPLVATPFALGAIAATHERELLVADDTAAFAAQTVRLLRDAALRERLAGAARTLVERRYSWERSVGALEATYERVAVPVR